jgi:hypothetical protein
MSPETPIEILELPNQLRELFSGKLPECNSGTAEQKELNLCEEKGYVSRQVTGEEGETVRSFRSVFSSAADCQSLRGGLLAKLQS